MKTITAKAIVIKASEQMVSREKERTIPTIHGTVISVHDISIDTIDTPEETAFSSGDLSMERPIISAKAIINSKNNDEVSLIPSCMFEREESKSNLDKNINNDKFIMEVSMAIRKLSKRIEFYLQSQNVYDSIRESITDRNMYSETFYKKIYKCIYDSLIRFCGWIETNASPDMNDPTLAFKRPCNFVVTDRKYTDTLIFVERLWNDNRISRENDNSIIMNKYREIFHDYDGIQPEAFTILRERIRKDMPMIDEYTIERIVSKIEEVWCTSPKSSTGEMSQEIISAKCRIDTTDKIEDGVVFSMDMDKSSQVKYDPIQHDTTSIYGDDDDQDEACEEDDEEPEYLSIDIYFEDNDFDIVKINSEDAFGKISIPIYTNLSEVSSNDETPSQVSELNGLWDWLIHMVPDMLFRTRTPEKYMDINNECMEEDQMHVVVMDENDGEYTMGIFRLDGIFIVDEYGRNLLSENDNEILAKINNIIKEDIGTTRMSHLARTLMMTELIHDEEYITSVIMENEDDDDEEEEDNELTTTDTNKTETEEQDAQVLQSIFEMIEDERSADENLINQPTTNVVEVGTVIESVDGATRVEDPKSEDYFYDSKGNPIKVVDVIHHPNSRKNDESESIEISDEIEESFVIKTSEVEKTQESVVETVSEVTNQIIEPVHNRRLNEAEQDLPGDGILYPVRRKDRYNQKRKDPRDRDFE